MIPEKEEIRRELLSSGAIAVGFAAAAPVEEKEWLRYMRWLEEGRHASMDYMERYPDVRRDPRLLLEGAGTVISLAFSYVPSERRDNSNGIVACYAYGRDYHKVLKRRLDKCIEALRGRYGGEYRLCVDSAPILEKYWAQRAGIGFRGRNELLIVPGAGSMVFLAEIVTTLRIEPDEPCRDLCAGCGKCVEVCPGNALRDMNGLESRRCINYLTIEHKGPWTDPVENEVMRTDVGRNTIFGCDLCMTVCPHNKNVRPAGMEEFRLGGPASTLSRERIAGMSREEFDREITGTPIRRAGYEGLRRNVSER